MLWVDMINQKYLLNLQLSWPQTQSRDYGNRIIGPVVTIYVYEDAKWAETRLELDTTSEYALTGAVSVKIVMLSKKQQ
jgi:hypothetical protein